MRNPPPASDGARPTTRVGSFLPHIELPAAPDGAATPLRSAGREAVVLVRVHAATCRDCRRYLADLATSGIDLAWWEGRVVVLVPGPLSAASALRADLELPFVVVGDVDDRAPLVNGAGVIIADRYGQVYYVGVAGFGHEFPAPLALEEWLKFLATQCPE
jgi:hypothetical protein